MIQGGPARCRHRRFAPGIAAAGLKSVDGIALAATAGVRRLPSGTANPSPVPKASSTPERVSWAIEQLALGPSDDVLEIGCGGGHAVTLLCERLPRGGVTAIDRSSFQVQRARERNARWIASGRARIEELSLIDAPEVLGRGRFDRALAINVNAFWTTPAPSLEALRELLSPRGRAFLVFEPPSPARLRAARQALPDLVSAAGLTVVDVRTATLRRGHGLCIIGERGPEPSRVG